MEESGRIRRGYFVEGLGGSQFALPGAVDRLRSLREPNGTVVALATPNALLGRVNAVEGVFISASNELGAFESGLAAALIGAVPAVVIGGAITIALALVWGRLFPPLAQVDRLEDVRPVEVPAVAAGVAG